MQNFFKVTVKFPELKATALQVKDPQWLDIAVLEPGDPWTAASSPL
jgi:hypothetical protein